jgi:hypothetical protein
MQLMQRLDEITPLGKTESQGELEERGTRLFLDFKGVRVLKIRQNFAATCILVTQIN